MLRNDWMRSAWVTYRILKKFHDLEMSHKLHSLLKDTPPPALLCLNALEAFCAAAIGQGLGTSYQEARFLAALNRYTKSARSAMDRRVALKRGGLARVLRAYTKAFGSTGKLSQTLDLSARSTAVQRNRLMTQHYAEMALTTAMTWGDRIKV